MALDSTKKKRANLLSIVDRLVEKTEEKNYAILRKKQEEVLSPSPRSTVSIRPYLLPPTPSSGPASPLVSDQESEEGQLNDKGTTIDYGIEEIKKDLGVPKQPLRCDICGLRVYKSYRYINRTSAPAHLKTFVTPDNDRIRACKRCFSSRERCRQNLALVLLRSKTREMIHLRTPLGVTYNRATKSIDYIARDLKKGFKRPYEDLLCDETMADEDEMEGDDERFLLNGTITKNQGAMPKLFGTENGNAKQGVVSPTPIPVKNVGIVTVVRRHSGKFSSTPNSFTIYGDVGNLKVTEIAATGKVAEQNENVPTINVSENLKKLTDQSSSLSPSMSIATSSEINTINNKLTFLDHAYALPPPKGKLSPVPKTQAVNKIKTNVPKVMKGTDVTKQVLLKKTVSPDGQTTSERTCGIVCFMCDNLVTKSYSCYKSKEDAPDKIKHLFTPGVRIVKICRRCMPYKKPKDEDGAAATGKGKTKVVKGKLAKIKSAKLIKNAKSTGKGSTVKTSEKKGEKKRKKKRKNSTNEDNLKAPVKKQYTVVVQTKKMSTSKGPVTKDIKVINTKPMQITLKGVVRPVKQETKLEIGNSNIPNGSNTGAKIFSILPKSSAQKDDKMYAAEKPESSTVETEIAAANKLKSAKVDSGTQSMKSMIGINRGKAKPADSAVTNEDTVQANKPVSLNIKEINDSITKEGDGKVTVKQENVTESTMLIGKNDEKNNTQLQNVDSEEMSKEKTVLEQNKMDIPQEESDVVLLKEPGDDKTESKNTEAKAEDKAETATDSKNVTDTLNMRERRSSSKSPVRAREVKPVEVPSPRRGRSSGTPDKKREDYKQITPTVMTRKRLASFSESEVEKKGDNDTTAVGGKRRAVVALLEKMSRKSGDPSSAQSVPAVKVKEESTNAAESPEEEAKGHCMTRRNQMPIKCPGCNEKVVKSYRCVMRGTAPVHIKPLFQQQADDMLRICRKCVMKKGKS